MSTTSACPVGASVYDGVYPLAITTLSNTPNPFFAYLFANGLIAFKFFTVNIPDPGLGSPIYFKIGEIDPDIPNMLDSTLLQYAPWCGLVGYWCVNVT